MAWVLRRQHSVSVVSGDAGAFSSAAGTISATESAWLSSESVEEKIERLRADR
jgi:hypothetical protein